MGKYNPVPRKISDPHRARSVWHSFRCVRSYAGNAQLTGGGGLDFRPSSLEFLPDYLNFCFVLKRKECASTLKNFKVITKSKDTEKAV